MARRQHSNKMTDRQRRLRYTGRRALWVGILLAIAGAVVAADRLGLFGDPPVGDAERYHAKTFRVTNVIDGDTLDVDIRDGKYPQTRIRLWGVDTPETVKPDTPPQHFGPEASAFTKNACLGKDVRLELIPRSTRGRHDRLLAYVHLPDGRMLNRILVAEGYAYADPRFDHTHKAEFRRLQRMARQARLGLWKAISPANLPYYYRDLKLSPAGQPE